MQVEEQCARSQRRYESKASAQVTRERDPMRTVLRGYADDISIGGVALYLPIEVPVDDHLLVELENPIQRIRVQCRVRVRSVRPTGEGRYRVGCSFMPQLAGRDVQLLKSNQAGG